MNTTAFDPFANLTSDSDPGPAGQRAALLQDAKREYAAIRKEWVQRPNTEKVRPSLLAKFVSGRKERALDAFLLLHAYQPILEGTPLTLRTWARVLSTKKECAPADALAAFKQLEALKLVAITGDRSTPVIAPLKEDGSGDPWSRPGSDPGEGGIGYFTIPFDYWRSGLADRLGLPGKAMFLITLKETQDPTSPAFHVAYEKAQEWYGVSERTAERGFMELSLENVLLTKTLKKASARHPRGLRDEHWRALAAPYSAVDRQLLQAVAKSAVQSRSGIAAPTP